MTGLTASRFGISDRGFAREGFFADLVVFDPATVKDAATFADPIKPSVGIELVVVNGEVVWNEDASTVARPGRVLRKR